VFGLSISTGLGVMQLNSGLRIVTGGLIEENITNQTYLIGLVIIFAIVSVLTGIKNGSRRLSELTFILANTVLLVVFFVDDWKFCLNTFCDVTFKYLQFIIQLGGRTDSFAQSIP